VPNFASLVRVKLCCNFRGFCSGALRSETHDYLDKNEVGKTEAVVNTVSRRFWNNYRVNWKSRAS
jgi:hypothetical protein